MAAGSIIVPNKARLNLFNATALLSATAANWRLMLLASTYTPDNSDTGHELLADVSSHQIAAGNGYTSGGAAIANAVLSLSSGMKFDADDVVWTASGTGIPAWRYGLIYWLGTVNSKVNPILGHFLGDSTPADVPLTTAGNPLTVAWNVAGLVTSP